MTTFLKIALVLVGIGLAGWLAVVAHDIGTGYRRFSKLTDRAPERRPRPMPAERHTPRERAEGVV